MFTVFARGDLELIHPRITARHHEYMSPSLLGTQFDDLQERQDDERGLTVDIAEPPEDIVTHVTHVMGAISREGGVPEG